jgi:hypothetical protein
MSHGEVTPDCLNCNATLHGPYCHSCGQKATAANVSMHDFVHEATHEFLHLDGKILQTVKLLVRKPGQLTREFLDGRRARFISPVRVYLTFSLIFFTLATLLPGASKGMMQVESSGLKGDTEFERRLSGGLAKAEQDADKLGQAVLSNLPKAMFVLMPIFGLLTWAFYRRQQRFYIPHLYYSVHFHSFVFFVMTIYVVISRIGVPKPAAATLILTAVPYHFIALRRVFGGSRRMTFAKGVAIGLLYCLIVIAVVMTVTLTVLLNL